MPRTYGQHLSGVDLCTDITVMCHTTNLLPVVDGFKLSIYIVVSGVPYVLVLRSTGNFGSRCTGARSAADPGRRFTQSSICSLLGDRMAGPVAQIDGEQGQAGMA